MSEAIAHHPSVVDPLNEPSRGRRLLKIGGWLLAIVLVVVVLDLLGVDVVGWLEDLWQQIKDVPPGYIVAALIFQSGQTIFAGLSYYGILRAAYPGEVSHTEDWAADGKGYSSDIVVEIKGVPVKIVGTKALQPEKGGSSVQWDFEITSGIPLLGGLIASFAGDELKKNLEDEFKVLKASI